MRYKLHLLKVNGELYCELVSNDLAFLKEIDLTFTARGGAGPSFYYEAPRTRLRRGGLWALVPYRRSAMRQPLKERCRQALQKILVWALEDYLDEQINQGVVDRTENLYDRMESLEKDAEDLVDNDDLDKVNDELAERINLLSESVGTRMGALDDRIIRVENSLNSPVRVQT